MVVASDVVGGAVVVVVGAAVLPPPPEHAAKDRDEQEPPPVLPSTLRAMLVTERDEVSPLLDEPHAIQIVCTGEGSP